MKTPLKSALPSVKKIKVGSSRTKRPISILIVEDDPDYQKILTTYLGRQSYHIITCTKGSSAIRLLKNNSNVSLVLLDISLAEGNGFVVLENVKSMKVKDGFKICMLSVKNDPFSIMLALTKGADDYLVKDVHYQKIHQKIESMLGIKDHSAYERLIRPVSAFARFNKKLHNVTVKAVSEGGLQLESIHHYPKNASIWLSSLPRSLFGMEETALRVTKSIAFGYKSEINTDIIGLDANLTRQLELCRQRYTRMVLKDLQWD